MTLSKEKLAIQAVKAGISAVQPSKLITENVRMRGGKLIVKGKAFSLTGRSVYVIGFGKASGKMAEALEKIVRVKKGVVSVPRGSTAKLKNIKLVHAGHPLPDKGSLQAAKKMLELAREVKRKDLLIVLISGGGSSLLAMPVKGLSLKTIDLIDDKLLESGTEIHEFNILRKKMSSVKGGKLAKMFKCEIINLVISDVVGNDFRTIASGPTVANGTHNFLIGSNETAVDAVAAFFLRNGKKVRKVYRITGDARTTGKRFASMLNRGELFVAGGETTLIVKGKGTGGRNQELALEAALHLKRGTLLSIGTDGIDGNSLAAGAVVSAKTRVLAKKKKIRINDFLTRNDSNTFFKKLGNGLIVTGPTGTNVGDLIVGLS